ncbi:hypothetical protein G6F22_010742 [Rhizopus arrhizus]|nr:hypothetical protein G6F22_010742 [Rhizopus arrhizus]
MTPGGKPEPGEAPLQALARELDEELGVQLRADAALALGAFEDWAVNEPGHRVRAQAWWVQVDAATRPALGTAERTPYPAGRRHPGDGPLTARVPIARTPDVSAAPAALVAAFALPRVDPATGPGVVLAVRAAGRLFRAAGAAGLAAARHAQPGLAAGAPGGCLDDLRTALPGLGRGQLGAAARTLLGPMELRGDAAVERAGQFRDHLVVGRVHARHDRAARRRAGDAAVAAAASLDDDLHPARHFSAVPGPAGLAGLAPDRRMRLLALFPALLLFAALPASADALRCGEYRSLDDGMALVFTSPSSGYRHNGIGEPEPLWVDRSAEQTRLVMLDDGVAEPIRISADGQRIEDSVTVVYTLRQSRACTAEPSAVAGSCRAAGSYCMVQLPTASPGQARRACDESVGAGCSTLLRLMREGGAVDAADDAAPAVFERPPPCREHTGGHDRQACEAMTDDALAIAMRRVDQRLAQEDEDTLDSPLPAAARDLLQQLCLQHRGGRFCVEVAAQQLIALEPALACMRTYRAAA